MSYDDGRIACTDDALIIRRYYFPSGDKHLPYAEIIEVRRRTITALTGKWRLWGSGDFVHWWNYDPGRPGKNVALEIQQSTRSSQPVITPDNPDQVIAELQAHGVAVTTS
jgi:hypothetical protein